jgi:hypothetical protein
MKQSLRLRTRLIGKPGIVDREDPQLIVQSMIKPLWPTFAPNDYTTVMISSGRAVTPAGDIVELPPNPPPLVQPPLFLPLLFSRFKIASLFLETK